jgi:hypothetical protein
MRLSERYAYAPIDGKRRPQHFGSAIGQHDRQPNIRHGVRVEIGSKQRVAAIEQIVDETENLHLVGNLVRGVEIDQPIADSGVF